MLRRKKRRLEKALATSAAIRSELEKKKQKKKEEQQRLDEEGAAIAKDVTLHVLLGEDSDDSCKVMLRKEEGFNCWDYAGNFDLLWVEGYLANRIRDLAAPYFQEGGQGSVGLSVGLIAAQAVSALQSRETVEVDTVILNGMLRG
ncbi:hypothetical protein F3Y22_tig00117034pilonHSYRG01040 [Hibiscus syriacus]|uniref:Uncharacterized protein n=1 Tax=Hibiscus syriacus TaxID=106335 RepID=A0A6A2WGT5_HIBSY|nr:hypothetical protein F3Y22_tig00117034pilonHSYRG01040 [Hibiscus syriacus]